MKDIFTMIFELSCYGALVAVVVFGLKKLLGSRVSAVTHYALWFVLLLRLCVPLVPVSSFHTDSISVNNSYVQNAQTVSIGSNEAIAPNESAFAGRIDIENSTEEQKSPDIATIASVIYSFGLFGSIIWVAYICVRERREWVDIQMPKGVLDTFEQEYVRSGWSNHVSVVAAKCASPHVSGFLYPRIVIPESLLQKEMPEEVMRAVFRHEFGHLTQGDFWTWKLVTVLQVVHWFNPILWFAFRRMRADAELACDTRIMRGEDHTQRIQYGSALLFVAQQSGGRTGQLLSFSHHPLKQRVAMILSGRELPKHYVVRACALPVLLSVILLIPNFQEQSIHSVPWVIEEDGLYISSADQESLVKTQFPSDQLSMLQDEESPAYVYADSAHIVVCTNTTPINLMVSLDEGKTWETTMLPYAFPNKLFMGFSSQKSGWMFLEHSNQTTQVDHTFMITADGGRTWAKKSLPTYLRTADWNDILFVNQNEGYICCEQTNSNPGGLYRTQNAGETWQFVNLPITANLAKNTHVIDVEDFDDSLLLTTATIERVGEEYFAALHKYVSTDKNLQVWELCNEEMQEIFLEQKAITLISDTGYQLTLPYFWNGHICNVPSGDRIFSLYESYNYNILNHQFPNDRYGYVLSIWAIPLTRASQEQRTSDFTIGEDNRYCFIINETGGINCAKDPLAVAYYRMMTEDFSWIFQKFTEKNHLRVNPNCYVYE